MAIVINGSGTVTGLAVGGLPDGTVDAGTLATNSVDSAELIDGAVDNSHIGALAASKLTGALPAISAANLTAIPAANITGTLPAISGANLTGVAPTRATMPVGSILQVVSANLGGTGLETSSSTPADMCTVTLTPTSSSNKILIFASNAQTYGATSGPQAEVRVYSDKSSAYIGNVSTYQGNFNIGYAGGGSISLEQSLAGWSGGAITYRLRGASRNNVYIQLAAYGLATLTCMEVKL